MAPSNGEDGGCYAWLVVVASHVCMMFVFGLYQAFGTVFLTLQSYFEETSANTSWVIAVMMCTEFALGPVSGMCSTKIGHRRTVMLGAIISTTGYLASSLAPNIKVLYLTFGFVVGFGYALVFSPSLGIVALYVRKKYALANSIVMSGSGTGSFVFSPLFQVLIDRYGWKGAFIVFAGINAQMCVCACLFRVPGENSRQDGESRVNGVKDRAKTVCQVFDFHVFRDHPKFTLITVTYTLGYSVGFVGSPSHIIPRAGELGIGDAQSRALFMSMMGAFTFIGRFVPVPILMREETALTASRIFGLSLLCLGITNLLSPLAVTYATHAVYVCAAGVFNGVCVSVLSYCVKEIVGAARFTTAISVSSAPVAAGVLVGPVLAGYIYDVTGNYNNSFYFYGTCSATAGILMLSLDSCATRLDKKLEVQRTHKEIIELDVHSDGVVT